jgi:hypothetical protein
MAQPLTTAFDRGYLAGEQAGPWGAKPANPYKSQRLFNTWEYGFSHAQLAARAQRDPHGHPQGA